MQRAILHKPIVLSLVIWFLIAIHFLMSAKVGKECGVLYDCAGHLEYTEIIINQHHLPLPFEGTKTQTYQPPLYYLINSFLLPKSFYTEVNLHINLIKFLSVFYGAISLLFISRLLDKFGGSDFFKLIVLIYLCTTPEFIFFFTSYSNDSLAILLSIMILVLSYELYFNWSTPKAFYLLIIGVASLYTKYNTLIPIVIVLLICLKIKSLTVSQVTNKKRIMLILLLSCVLLLPWLYEHNYKNTHKLFPTNFEFAMIKKDETTQVINAFKKVLRIPFFQLPTYAWEDPYIHISGGPRMKTEDYWAYMWIDSVIGLWVLQSPSEIVVWSLLITHLIIYLAALYFAIKSLSFSLTKLSLMVILITQLFSICAMICVQHTAIFGEYRYIAWEWIAWAILYINLLSSKKELFTRLFILSIIINSFVAITSIGNSV